MKEIKENTKNFKVEELEKLASDVMKKFKDDKSFENFYSHVVEYVDGFVSEDALVEQYGYSYEDLEDDEGYLNAVDTFILHVWDIMNESMNNIEEALGDTKTLYKYQNRLNALADEIVMYCKEKSPNEKIKYGDFISKCDEIIFNSKNYDKNDFETLGLIKFQNDVYEYYNDQMKNLNESRKIVKEAKDTELDDREFFDNFKLKLHKTSFGYYDVYDWIYDMTGIMPHKDEIYGVLKAWEDKGWIKTDKNKFGAEIFRLVLDERLNQNIPLVRNIPMHESRRRNRKMMKESIDINKYQTIKITDEMKNKYPSLKDYDEILIEGKKMNWWDADKIAYYRKSWLPNRDELKDIWKIINLDGDGCAWTNEVYELGSDGAYYVCSDGKITPDIKSDEYNVICLR